MNLPRAAALLTTVSFTAGAQDTVRHWQHEAHARSKVTSELASRFEQATGTRVTTEYIPFGQYFDKLVTALASSTAPDVMQVPADMAEQLIGAKLIAPRPESLGSARQYRNTYLPWTQRFVKNGQVYGTPVDTQTLVLYINDQLYAEAGFKPSDYPKTWAQFAEQARKLTKRDARGMTQAGLDTRYYDALLNYALYCGSSDPIVNTAGRATYDQARNQAGFNRLAELVRGPDRVRDPEFLPGQRPFDLGKAAFYVNHPAASAGIENAFKGTRWTYTAVPLPRMSENAPQCTVGSHWAWVVNAASKNPAKAWEWIQYATNKNNQVYWLRNSGDLPTRRDLVCDPKLARDPVEKVTLNSLKYATPEIQVGRTEVEPIFARVWERLTLTSDPVGDILGEAAAQQNKVNADAMQAYGAQVFVPLVESAKNARTTMQALCK